MKTVIQNILAVLDKDKFIYTDTGIKETEEGKEMPYLELITNEKFVNALAMFISRYAPRSKRKPKIVWPEGMLNYEKFEYIVEDIKVLFGSTILDGTTKEYLQEFYEKNLLPNITK